MLHEAELDIAIVCTWGAFHAETGIQICDSGRVKAVLCEKPFTQNAAEAAAFAAAGRKNRVLVAEAFKFRHHPMHLRAKAMIDAGAIGGLVGVRSTFCTSSGGALKERSPESNWRFNKAKGGGSIYDLACYNIHHARFCVWRGAGAGVCRATAGLGDRRCHVDCARLFRGPHRADRRGF